MALQLAEARDTMHRKLAASARDLGDLRHENNDLRRELIHVLERDRREWISQPQSQELLADNEELRASLDALERMNAQNVELQHEIAERQARARANTRAVEEQRDRFLRAAQRAEGEVEESKRQRDALREAAQRTAGEHEKAIARLDAAHREARAEAERAAAESRNLQAELAQMSAAARDNEHRIAALNSAADAARGDARSHREALARAELELHKSAQRVESLEAQLGEARQSASAERIELESQLRRRQRELEEVNAVAKQHEDNVTELRDQKETLTAALTIAQRKSGTCVIA